MKIAALLSGAALVCTAQAAIANDYYATGTVDNLPGTAGADNYIVNRRVYIPGDTYNGAGGLDTLWITKTMTAIDFPAANFDFTSAKVLNIEVLAFNYMLMEMPGNVIFSSAQFGAGLLPNNLSIYGAWGDQDIAVNLVSGNSNFDASGWVFKTDMIPFGAVWGPYFHPSMGEVGGVDTIHLNGSAGNNTIIGTQKDDIIAGNAGNDTIEGGAGKDVINGGPGVDTASYARASTKVTVNLGLTSPQNTGGAGIDTISQVENLIGSPFDDKLVGDALANVIEGGLGNDIVQGAAGYDTASYQHASARVAVNLATTVPQNTLGAGVDTLIQIENLIGSAFNDTLAGNSSPNVIEGGLGNDTIDGAGGFDTASYASAPSGVTVNLALVGAQNTIAAGVDTLISIEGVLGSSFHDTLIGNAGANIFEGGPGHDTINGGVGVDTASYAQAPAGVSVNLGIAARQNTVGAGWDLLIGMENLLGSAFDDQLAGNGLANVIEGGAGKDTMSGAAGPDTFVFTRLSDSVVGARRDVITDFVSGVDKIDLWRIDANTVLAGDQPFTYIGAAAFRGLPGDLRFAGGVLSGDVNGDRVADFEIALTGVASLNPTKDLTP